ncbi:hypothetical protein J5N97_007860 [Dioscorea zingiberensis]|uniref:CCR4-NOT transcription complex subunit 10 n=1 Tax=Dioscorea zingiberensis TaxID=325984 RepID=A0A9D5DDA5_9LILI|nr:hypothetical protein J5N97_007860 [Dioscorea zingiberensis]
MDGRDSTAPGGDGPVEEDGALSITAALAKEAAGLFQNRRYSECLDVLNQLSRLKEDDPKVVHNMAVAQYFRDGCSNPRKLLDVLDKVKKRSEDLACTSGKELEVTGNHGSNLGSGSSASPTPYQFSAPNSSHITYAAEFDASIVTLNIAVILFLLHDYDGALSRLEPLYQNMKPVDEASSLQICFLLLDIALASQDAQRAADVIQYLEKSFGVGCRINQVDVGAIAKNHSSNELVSTNSNVNVLDVSRSDSSNNANIPENSHSLALTLSDESLEYETFLSAMDGGAPNLGRSALNDATSSGDLSTPDIVLKSNVQLYKVKFLLLTRNLKAVDPELKLATNIPCSTEKLIKAQLEYALGNHKKARELLTESRDHIEPGMAGIFHNNLGCISHRLGEHHTAILYSIKALKSCSALRSERPLKLSTYSQDKTLLIYYNCGLQYLACGKPLIAARCFQKATPFRSRPLLWLRFAECCLLAQEKGLLRKTPASSSEEIKVQVIGSGKWRHLIVENVNSRNRHLDAIGEDVRPDDKDRLSLPFARRCLNKALDLLNELEEKTSKHSASSSTLEVDNPKQAANHKTGSHGDSKGSASMVTGSNGDSKETKANPSTIFQSYISSYVDMSQKENHMVKQAVLCDLAYVELSLENPKKALSAARQLQQLSDCSRMYSFLSHVYAAEAHCHLNQPKEALEQLAVYLSDSPDVTLPYNDEDTGRWKADGAKGGGESNSMPYKFLKPEEARGVLYLNLATMFSIEGNLDMARQFVTKALSHLSNNPRAVLAAIYMDLLQGKTQDALVKLKQSRHVKFYPSGVDKQ